MYTYGERYRCRDIDIAQVRDALRLRRQHLADQEPADRQRRGQHEAHRGPSVYYYVICVTYLLSHTYYYYVLSLLLLVVVVVVVS